MAVRSWVESKATGDISEEQFLQHCYQNNWMIADLTGSNRDQHGAPVAVKKTGNIKAPDYFISKPPLPAFVVEVKSKAPAKDGMFWLDEPRWQYLKEYCRYGSMGGLFVIKQKPYETNDIDQWICATVEQLAENIDSFGKGGVPRSYDGFQRPAENVVKWYPSKFIPLKQFLSGKVRSGIRYSFYLESHGVESAI